MLNTSTPGLLSQTQYLYRLAILRDNPYLYYRMNERSGTTVTDSGQGGRNALLENTNLVYDYNRPIHQAGTGYHLMIGVDTPPARVFVNHRLATSTTFSIEFWWNRRFNPYNNGLFAGYWTGFNWDFRFSPVNSSARTFTMVFNGTILSGFNWLLGANNHTVLTFGGNNGNNISIYNNGILIVSYINTNSFGDRVANIANANNWYIGHGNTTSNNAFARINNFATYNYALSLAQIQKHYELGKLWMPFDSNNLLLYAKEDIGHTVIGSDKTANINLVGTQNLEINRANSLGLISGYDGTSNYGQGGTNRILQSGTIALSNNNFYIGVFFTIMATPTTTECIVSQSISTGTAGTWTLTAAPVTGGYNFIFTVKSSPDLVLQSTLKTGTGTPNGHYFICISRNGSSLELRINNVSEANGTSSQSFSSLSFVILGRNSSSTNPGNQWDTYAPNIRFREIIVGTQISDISNLHDYIKFQYGLTLW